MGTLRGGLSLFEQDPTNPISNIVPQVAEQNQFTLFPVPARDMVTIVSDFREADSVFNIIDAAGKTVSAGKITGINTSIELNLSAGVYFVKVISSSAGPVGVQKLIIAP